MWQEDVLKALSAHFQAAFNREMGEGVCYHASLPALPKEEAQVCLQLLEPPLCNGATSGAWEGRLALTAQAFLPSGDKTGLIQGAWVLATCFKKGLDLGIYKVSLVEQAANLKATAKGELINYRYLFCVKRK